MHFVSGIYPNYWYKSGLQISVHNQNVILLFSAKTFVVGTKKNRLNEAVLLSTNNICLN